MFIINDFKIFHSIASPILQVILSDFGLAKELDQSSGRYEIPNSALDERVLPTALLAPESWSMGIFDMCTEVWAFGVLLWEIFSLGQLPYAGMPSHDIERHIRAGYRLEKPKLASVGMYELMKSCWDFDPKERPKLHHVISTIAANRKQIRGDTVLQAEAVDAPEIEQSSGMSQDSQVSRQRRFPHAMQTAYSLHKPA